VFIAGLENRLIDVDFNVLSLKREIFVGRETRTDSRSDDEEAEKHRKPSGQVQILCPIVSAREITSFVDGGDPIFQMTNLHVKGVKS
jgi:hypothetical protein